MPFVRYSRDRRGYEHVYLVQPANRRGKPGRARVLYWFRTPPGIKVGRQPFDPDMQHAIEKQNPDVAFDWPRLIATPKPPVEIDWRERRRAQRALKGARSREESEEAAEIHAVPIDELPEDVGDQLEPGAVGESPATAAGSVPESGEPSAQQLEAARPSPRGRRRGGRRRRRGRQPAAAAPGDQPSAVSEEGAGPRNTAPGKPGSPSAE